MSKQCLNCGREISGEGRNKIFCDDCFRLVSSFLREIQSQNESAMNVFNSNRARFFEAGISLEAERYIEKCCRRYDEKNGFAPARQPVTVIPPEQRRQNENDVPGSQIAPTPNVPEYPVEENAQTTPEKQNNSDNPETIMFAPVGGARRQAASAAGVSPVKDASGSGGGNRDGSGDGSGGDDTGRDSDDERRRLILICIAAAVAIVIFVILAVNGWLSSLTKNPNSNETDNGNRPGITTDGNGTIGTEPGTDEPGTDDQANETLHVHNWVEATCTDPRTCSLCGETEGGPLGHNYGEGSCDEPAVCLRCGESSGTTSSHVWGDPVFTWTNNTTVTVTFTCLRDSSHKETANATVTTSGSTATCTEAGLTKYTATVTKSGITYTDERDNGTTPALGHSWGTPTFTWSADNTSCTATFVCTRDASHTETVAATVAGPQTIEEPTCADTGTERTTASVIFNNQTYADKKDTTLPSLGGHNFPDGEIACSRCGEYRAQMRGTGTAYKDRNSELSVMVKSITRSGNTYTVNYFLENDSTELSYDEGTFRLYLTSGGYINAVIVDDNGTDYIEPGEVREHTVTFTLSDGDTPLLLEYHSPDHSYGAGSQIFTNSPDDAMYWLIP